MSDFSYLLLLFVLSDSMWFLEGVWLHQEPGRLGSRVTRCFSMSLRCSSSFPRLQFLFLCFVLFLLVEVWLWGVTLKMTMRCTSWKMAVGGAGGN